MKESIMWNKLKDNYKSTEVFLQRVEMTHFPDIYFRTKENEGWIELKQIPKLTESITIPFRPGQLSWLMRYLSMGGNANMLVSINDIDVFLFKDERIRMTYLRSNIFHLSAYYGPIKNLPFNTLFY